MKFIKRIPAHYEVQNVEMGKVYRRCPESVIIECDYDETLTLTASRTTCGRCGADHAAIAEEVLDPRSEESQSPLALSAPILRAHQRHPRSRTGDVARDA